MRFRLKALVARVRPCGSAVGGDNIGIFRKRPIFVCLMAAFWLSGVAALDLFAVDEFPPISLGEAESQLREMGQVMEARFRHMPGRDAFESANGAISNFNASCEAKSRAFGEWRAKLDAEFQAIRRQEAELKEVDAKLKAATPRRGERAAVESYNARVSERNQLLGKLDARNSAHKGAVESYNRAIQQFNSESESQRKRLQSATKAAVSRVNEQQRWLMNRSDVEFYRRVNVLNARLVRSFGGAATGKPLEYVKAAAALRAELGEKAAREEQQRTNGLVIVEALLGERIKCHMIVDTGASTVTISSAVASMLDLTNGPVEEVESTLAGGLVIKGRKVTLPSLGMDGQRVTGVEAMVIPESGCGVDGLLGHSFLDHFAWEFDKDRTPPVRFRPRGPGMGEAR